MKMWESQKLSHMDFTNRYKTAITVGLLILMVWCIYITTLIYAENPPSSMKERCVEPMLAQTKVCNSNVYTHFGNPFGEYP